MLIGQDRAGKTSLKKSFLGLPFDPEEASTEGIEVDPSTFDIEVDHVKNWQRTDEKFDVSYFVNDIARMVATEIQELKEIDRDSELQNISVEVHSENRQVGSFFSDIISKLSFSRADWLRTKIDESIGPEDDVIFFSFSRLSKKLYRE